MKIYGGMRFRDRGWMRILDNVQKLGTIQVKVGAVGRDAMRKHPSRKETVADVLLWNEFGARNHQGERTPARMPLRRTFTSTNQAVYAMGLGVAHRAVTLKQSATTAMRWMGEQAVDAIRVTIAKGLKPNNAARTVKRKGFDHPLIETGVLWASMAYRLIRDAKPLGHSEGVVFDNRGKAVHFDVQPNDVKGP